MGEPLITMRIEVLDARAVTDFIKQIDPKKLKDEEVLTIAKALDKKLAEVSMEKWRREL